MEYEKVVKEKWGRQSIKPLRVACVLISQQHDDGLTQEEIEKTLREVCILMKSSFCRLIVDY